MIELRFKRLHPEAILPRRWSPLSVGWDVHAHLISESNRPNKCILAPRSTRNVSTGLLIEPPAGYFVMVCSRSGLADKSIFVTNAPGIIDPDYRGELKVLMYNGSHETYFVSHQDRIAQLVLVPMTDLQIVEVEHLTPTERGDSGFGSTGR